MTDSKKELTENLWLSSGKFWTKFSVAFAQTLKDAESIYNQKGREYGDSWRTCSEEFLERRLNGEFEEWLDAIKHLPTNKQHKELLDIINVALMLATRTKSKAFEEESAEEKE